MERDPLRTASIVLLIFVLILVVAMIGIPAIEPIPVP
jgi:hypothetical protein